MATVAEIAANLPLRDALQAATAALSAGQSVAFTKYVKRILPIDGYVFWLAGETIHIPGSFHYSTGREQREDETISINRVVFTTQTEIANFNEIDPQTIWIATFDGIRFAFARRGDFYVQAGTYHYAGEAVYSALASQLVQNLYTLAAAEPIVSNSLPAWLAVQYYSPIWLSSPNPGITLYPSFLVPANITPPYGVVHIDPARTTALQAAPRIDGNSSHYQLATDHVRVTLYGYNNAQAQTWIDTVNSYSFDTDAFGLMNSPILRDEKRGQMELQAIAMKKTVEFDISYYQSRISTIAKQLIENCIVQYSVTSYPTTG
jgi:hypothetical protein